MVFMVEKAQTSGNTSNLHISITCNGIDISGIVQYHIGFDFPHH